VEKRVEKQTRPNQIKTSEFASYEAINERDSAAIQREISKLLEGEDTAALKVLVDLLKGGHVVLANRVDTDTPLNHMCLAYRDYLTQGDWMQDVLRYVRGSEAFMDGADRQASQPEN